MVKFNNLIFLWVYLASLNFSSVNNLSAACEVMETFYLQCSLPWLTLPPSICTQTRPNCDKKSVCLAKHFTQTNRILHRHACGACDKFHVWTWVPPYILRPQIFRCLRLGPHLFPCGSMHWTKVFCIACLPNQWANSQNLVYFLWLCAWHWGSLISICQNHCVCMPSSWASMTKSVISFFWVWAWHWGAPTCICQTTVPVGPVHETQWQNPVYLFCGAVLGLSLEFPLDTNQSFVETTVLLCRTVEPWFTICICQNYCACVPSPWASMTKSGISVLWQGA